MIFPSHLWGLSTSNLINKYKSSVFKCSLVLFCQCKIFLELYNTKADGIFVNTTITTVMVISSQSIEFYLKSHHTLDVFRTLHNDTLKSDVSVLPW